MTPASNTPRGLRGWWFRRRMRKAGISSEPLTREQMYRAVLRSRRENWKDVRP